ncbi:hypothetical protein MYCTH_2294421 [Thermothelomyces thermophilus ATCC 42464]|uniref:Uncharacterized protein n=1 Tax=Thermothelomyces thermophilus (strain ATCC 42464 / BCRC 31852 / DSM 1799) TaxID=573729 RepID=G2Q1A3_THET4|nr:uncharacterized protein MYCTH_2294421 [Thermothelomyces thermophilus ATCC 42464]AEO53295.1 hypothetical protein MYCTH_2294421 [Thermothelomyces thermophilus ATCC 42464]
MPFGEDLFPDRDLSPAPIQSDLLKSLEAEMDRDYGEVQSAGPTIVTLADRAVVDREPAGVPEPDQQVQAEEKVNAASPEPAAPSSTFKTRGRPSLSASATPVGSAASGTPKSATTPKGARASSGKRKAAQGEPKETETAATPVPKRGRPARTAGVSASARLAAAAANKPARGRPRSTTVSDPRQP